RMPVVAEVADEQVIEADREDGVAAARRALVLVMEGPEPSHKDLADLVLAGAAQHHGLARDRLEAGMTGVLVRDRHEVGLGPRDGVARLGIRGVGEDDALAAAHTEASVSQPSEVHRGHHNTRNTPRSPRVTA